MAHIIMYNRVVQKDEPIKGEPVTMLMRGPVSEYELPSILKGPSTIPDLPTA